MSQNDLGSIPGTTSGNALAALLRNWRDALHTTHSGTGRPSYVQPGMIWIDTSSPTSWLVKNWTGTVDAVLARVTPASGEVNVRLGNSAFAVYRTNALLTATVPLDDTIPQSNEGTQILSATIQASSAASKIRGSVCLFGSASQASSIVASVFAGDAVNALHTAAVTVTDANLFGTLDFEFEHSPGAAGTITYAVRVGPVAGTLLLNGLVSFGRRFGGAAGATLRLQEIVG